MPTHEDLGGANWSDEKLYEKNQNRLTNVRWKFSEDPHDPDADPSSGFEYVKLEGPENPLVPPNPYKGVGGVDSQVACFRCRTFNFSIIDHRTSEQVLAELPVEQWRRSQGRGDMGATPEVYLLVCPNCDQRLQITEQGLEALRRAKKGRE